MFSTLRFFAFGAALLVASAGAQSNCDRFYAVNTGDTCDAISARQNVSTFQLQYVNNNTVDAACDNLFAGEVLCLGLQGEDCTTTFVVGSTDTCATITTAYNISLATVLANNPNVNSVCSNIYPGEVLCVASQVFQYP
ncbi:hypothetical protein EWM64_g3837 [Hericium alpestre]|uniref:LysM domain-containing protein n=1 Tax=Hericium alpestre TaxID=135208 RepID=A0A4Z0A2T4_9AGAM|nr:hypothetical protein EWM64_g3837 [Hericium alpestre]